MSDLHTAIMNIPAKGPGLGGWKADCTQTAYRMGHRDARHAAAELASEFAASHQRLKTALADCIAAIERTAHVDEAGRLAAADCAREALKDAP